MFGMNATLLNEVQTWQFTSYACVLSLVTLGTTYTVVQRFASRRRPALAPSDLESMRRSALVHALVVFVIFCLTGLLVDIAAMAIRRTPGFREQRAELLARAGPQKVRRTDEYTVFVQALLLMLFVAWCWWCLMWHWWEYVRHLCMARSPRK
eukprot:TRINITY_DN48146_c0_g1_i1.p1 TRINITY_DN48146_c0_g1~~TRINITY_DN48146_c0_g1_i1.p1  ORF type:complete len:178 (+),score=30.08 TRINITY_DN48146_c0_g1_i1:81-536(+)